MDNLKLYITSATGLVGATISHLVDGLGLALVVLLGLMAADFITGLLVAISNKAINSTVGRNGFIRKLYVVILIGAVYMVERVALDSQGYIGDGITIAYCLVEFISITENGGKLGVPMPQQLKNVIATLKSKEG